MSQKQLMIDALKNEQASEVEEMREQLADAQHEKKLLKLRFKSMTHAFEKEMEEVRRKKRDVPLQVRRDRCVRLMINELMYCSVHWIVFIMKWKEHLMTLGSPKVTMSGSRNRTNQH